jgi:hypothetical protein
VKRVRNCTTFSCPSSTDITPPKHSMERNTICVFLTLCVGPFGTALRSLVARKTACYHLFACTPLRPDFACFVCANVAVCCVLGDREQREENGEKDKDGRASKVVYVCVSPQKCTAQSRPA